MPSEDTISAEVQKEQKETQKETLIEIRKLVQAGQGSAKQRLQLVQNMSKIEKSNRTLGGDLSKNVKDMKDGIQTTVDGMINETFGPLGGVVSSFTTGWFKRAEDNKEKVAAPPIINFPFPPAILATLLKDLKKGLVGYFL